MAILKPNIPLKYVKPDGTTQSEYPLTSIDQVIDEDGIHRLNQTIVRVDLSDVEEGTVVPTNADLLENHPASYYATSEELNTKANKSDVDNSLSTKANSNHTHSYNDLTNKPTIPSALSPYPVGSVYFSVNNTNPSTYFGGTWVQIGSKLAVRENVVGNGKTLGITNGSNTGGLTVNNSSLRAGSGLLGTDLYTYGIPGSLSNDRSSGVPTKAQLGDNPQNSGLIVDTETIYSWKRTA